MVFRAGNDVDNERLERSTELLCTQIFSVSAQLAGVCVTVIGLFRVLFRLKTVDSAADNVLALDAFVFLVSCFTAYLALRARNRRRQERLATAADLVFSAGLLVMVVVGGLVAYEWI
jgi:multisubunit Na+/H+ antiporter MnhF subunit